MRLLAERVVGCCRQIATFTEEPGRTTRTFLSPPMRGVHDLLATWMKRLGMEVSVDAAGNLRGLKGSAPRRLIIGSHLDTVPNAGAFDGILGVVMGIALVELIAESVPGIAVEVIGFSEEEGVRFGIPFVGSRAVVGTLDDATLATGIGDAIRAYGLDPGRMNNAWLAEDSVAYLEIHIEQGPVLESLAQPLGVVECIAGQSRQFLTFNGSANHAGTTPMTLRRDALTAAAEWILFVENLAGNTPGLVATTGSIQAEPNATNVIAASARVSLDVRHAVDDQRLAAVAAVGEQAEKICRRRGLAHTIETRLSQPAVPMDTGLVKLLSNCSGGHLMTSGAGHDAMILAPHLPTVMLFLRSPGGISHHPDESVMIEDVEAALKAGLKFIRQLERTDV